MWLLNCNMEPLDGVYHNMVDYPEYYDPLCYPQYSGHTFCSLECTSSWLHLCLINARASFVQVNFVCSVFIMEEYDINVHLELTMDNIAHPSFHPSSIQQCLQRQQNKACNSLWLYSSELFLLSDCADLTVEALQSGVIANERMYIKKDVISTLVAQFQTEVQHYMHLSDESLWQCCILTIRS